MNINEARGLTSQQAWTHDHIRRCTCGAWTVVTDREAHLIAGQNYIPPDVCKHLTPIHEAVA